MLGTHSIKISVLLNKTYNRLENTADIAVQLVTRYW